MPIDSMTVHLTDGIKTGDYAPPKVYSLTALVTGPNIESEVEKAVALIVQQGEKFLGRAATPTTTRKAKETPAPAADPLAPAASAPAPASDPLSTSAAPVETAPSSDPLQGAAGTSDDPLTGAAPPADAKPITDDEIVHAVMTKNAELKDATKIRALVETYNPQPGLRVFKATEIEQADRAGFLVKLTALTTA